MPRGPQPPVCLLEVRIETGVFCFELQGRGMGTAPTQVTKSDPRSSYKGRQRMWVAA
jgi:hypothetical protein